MVLLESLSILSCLMCTSGNAEHNSKIYYRNKHLALPVDITALQSNSVGYSKEPELKIDWKYI
uniref:Secreted protein n=1 Tax=Haemonchus contortus TaxID=6289 RepID=A0A7I4YSA7_HAECO